MTRAGLVHARLVHAFVAAVALLATPAFAQIVDFGKYPDFKGQWSRANRNPNNWTPLSGPPPLTPEYQKIFEAITADVKSGGPGNWPPTFCIPAGMPGMMSLYDPMEMIVLPDITYILISHEDDAIRRIYTDGRDWPAEVLPTFAGYSIGKWIDEDGDGKFDALEVETRHLKLPRSYEVTGIPFHEDGKATIKERIWLDKSKPDTLYDEITVTDNALTRPWVKKQTAIRAPGPRPVWRVNDCAQENQHLQIAGETYMRSADGRLMPSKKNQPPPDLSYFRPAAK